MSSISVRRVDRADLRATVQRDLAAGGPACVADVLPPDRVAVLSDALDRAVRADAELLPPDRFDTEYGRVLFLPKYDRLFTDLLLDRDLMGPCEDALGEDCKLYTMTSACRPPHGSGWPIHVDSNYLAPGFTLALGVMILLDDFNEESGCTRFFPHVTPEPPSRESFDAEAIQLVAPAGSVCWFNGRSWHDALDSTIGEWRRCILIGMIRPWIMPRFDVTRLLSHQDLADLPGALKQKLGLDRLPPGSYDEFYLPAEDRSAALIERGRDAS